ncbi:NAD(P)/FAD-dependent oxidoreductase [Lacisediminihabitans sp. FW035]
MTNPEPQNAATPNPNHTSGTAATSAPDFDSIVIGGGAAGLAASMVLARARRRVLLIDAGAQNNLRTTHAGGVFLHDGEAPAALYARALEQLGRYPTFERRQATVASTEIIDGGFRVISQAEGAQAEGLTAKTIVLAQGVQFSPSTIPGADALWGTSVVNCPFCDGYESRDLRVLVAGTSDYLAHMSAMLPAWVDDLSYAEDTEIARMMHAGDGLAVTFTDGRSELFGRAFVQQEWAQRTELADALGCARRDDGLLELEGFGQTSVAGVFAAGDQSANAMQVNLAVGSGHAAGTGAVFALVVGPATP